MHFSFRFPSIILLTVFVGVLAGCKDQNQPKMAVQEGPANVTGTVQLEIDFQSDREKVMIEVPCSADSTVFKILERAQNTSDLKFKATGTSDPVTTFVNSIGGVDNLAGAGDNWTYRVNGTLGDRGAAMFSVKPGDKITWVFGKYNVAELPK